MNTSTNSKNPVQIKTSAMETSKPMLVEENNLFQWEGIGAIDFAIFKGLEIEGIKQYECGLCEPVEEGEKPDFISLYGRYADGGRDCIADFKPEITENDIVDFCNKLAAKESIELSIHLFDYD